MIRKMLSLMLLAILVALAGTACKKGSSDGADDKSYLVDPSSGTIPQAPIKPDPNADPCLKKGAVGAQALLLKGECPKITLAVCGNNIKESGEGCDDNNTKDGDGCSSTCQEEKKKDAPKGSVVISTQKNDEQFIKCVPGSSCTIKFQAKGMVGNNYNWSVLKSPTSFSESSKVNTASSYELKSSSAPYCDSKNPKYNASDCTVTVKVCPKGDSDPGHCDTQSFILASDHLVIKALHMADPNPYCTSEGSACAPFKFGELLLLDGKPYNYLSKEGGEVYFTAPKENDLLTSALVVMRLYVEGSFVKNDDSFEWKMTVNGTEVPVVTQKEMITNEKYGDYYTFTPVLPKGADVFLLNSDPQYHYILFSPPMFEKEVKNVVVTVTNAHGGKQSITFPSISVPSSDKFPAYSAQLAKAEQEKKDKADLEAKAACPELGKLTVNNKSHYVSTEIKYTDTGYSYYNWVSIPVDDNLRANEGYNGTINIVSGSGDYKIEDVQYAIDEPSFADSPSVSLAADKKNINIAWESFSKISSKTNVIHDTTQFDVVDKTGKCSKEGNKIHVKIDRILQLPDLANVRVDSLKLLANFAVEYASSNDSYVQFKVYGKSDSGTEVLFAETSYIAVSGDPKCYNQTYSLTPKGGHDGDSIDKVTRVEARVKDDYGNDMDIEFRYLRLESGNPVQWYAEAAGDVFYREDSDDWETVKYSAFSKHPWTGSIWFYGEPAAHPNEGGAHIGCK